MGYVRCLLRYVRYVWLSVSMAMTVNDDWLGVPAIVTRPPISWQWLLAMIVYVVALCTSYVRCSIFYLNWCMRRPAEPVSHSSVLYFLFSFLEPATNASSQTPLAPKRHWVIIPTEYFYWGSADRLFPLPRSSFYSWVIFPPALLTGAAKRTMLLIIGAAKRTMQVVIIQSVT